MSYIEKNCTITHEGKSFTSGGAVVTDDYLIAYPAENGMLSDWHGNPLGTYHVISSRRAIFFGRQSLQGERYYYMRAVHPIPGDDTRRYGDTAVTLVYAP